MYLYNFLNDNERNIKKKEKNCNKVAKAKTNCMVHIRNEPLAIFLNVSSSLKCQKWKLSLTLMLYNNIHSVFCLLLIYLLHVYIPFSMRFFLPSEDTYSSGRKVHFIVFGRNLTAEKQQQKVPYHQFFFSFLNFLLTTR